MPLVPLPFRASLAATSLALLLPGGVPPPVTEPGSSPAAAGPRAAAPREVPDALPTRPSPAAPRARWRWPVPDRLVVHPFDPPAQRWGRGHRGVDLAAATGARVRAVAGGVVVHAGRVAGRGTVTVAHPDGLRSTYEPVAPAVAAGDRVAAGAVVGLLEGPAGAGHCRPASCLHLGARGPAGYLDPLALLRTGPVVLLPLGHR